MAAKTTFNQYYEDQLRRLRELAVEFSRANPGLAPMLSGSSTDPDVERLLEGVAFLTGLTRQRLDDEFPELVQALTNLMFPQMLRPVPASAMIHFVPKGPLTESAIIPAATELQSMPVDGTRCTFRTCAALAVEPVTLTGFRWQPGPGHKSFLHLDFSLTGQTLEQWRANSLRLYLGGRFNDAARLFLLLMTRVDTVHIAARAGHGQDTPMWQALDRRALRASGFDDALLPYPRNAFPGFRVLQEFYALPEKFLFVDIEGLDRWKTGRTGKHFTVSVGLQELPDWSPELRSDTFSLNVVPAVNLFSHAATPISQDHRAAEHRLQPEGTDGRRYQIFSVDEVLGYRQGISEPYRYASFGLSPNATEGPSYQIVRRSATIGRSQDTLVSFAYPPGNAYFKETLSVKLTCTNGELPESLKLGDICHPTSSSPDRFAFRNIGPVAPSLNPPTGGNLLWRLISHLSLNLLSVADADNLRRLLGLYVFPERQERGSEVVNRRRIEGIEHVVAAPESRMIGPRVLHGQHILVTCRGDHYAGRGDMYLFGCVLDQFLSDYSGINAYTRLEIVETHTGERYQWSPRLGRQTLL